MTTLSARRPATSRKTRKGGDRAPITPEDLLEIQFISDARISPDGRRIVFVNKKVGKKNDYASNLWVVGAGGDGEPRRFTGGDRDSKPRWSPDGSRIAFVGAREKHRPQIFTIGADGGEAVALTDFPEGAIGAFRWSPDGSTIAVSFREQDPQWTQEASKAREEKGLSEPPRVIDHWWYRLDGDGYFNAQRYELYLVDARTGERRAVYGRDTMGTFSFDFSPDGKELVISTNRDRRAALKPWNDELLRLRISTGKLTPIPNLPKGPKDNVRWSPDGRLIAYAGREDTGLGDGLYSTENLELWVCDPQRGQARSLTGKEDYCLLAPPMTDTAEIAFAPVLEWAPDSSRIYMQIGWQGECHLASVPRAGGPVTMLTRGPHVHQLGNVSGDGTRVALIVGSVTRLDEVHVGDLTADPVATAALTSLSEPLLESREIVKPSGHWIKSADGNKVQVWVMPPAGHKAGRKSPAILEVHGGPHAQYGVGFFLEFQVLAAAGYGVVYANPRGSKGYGRDHCAAIRGAWGTADWVDVQAVIEFMRGLPWVDTKRMAIMGGSYGGYMTNWAIGHTDEFAAAVTDRCVSNLVSMYGSSDYIEPPDSYWPGNCWDRPEAMWESSPLKHIGSARTPTLIIHSEGDLRCNIEQAEQVHASLTHLKVPVRFVRYPRSCSHGMSRCGPPDMRLHRLGQILEWYKKHLAEQRSDKETK